MEAISRNAGILFIAEVAARAANFIVVIAIVRTLGAAPFGLMTFAFSLAGILSLLPDFGLQTYIVREVSQDENKARDLLHSSTILKIPLFWISLIVFLIWIKLTGFNGNRFLSAFLCALVVFFTEFQNFGNSFFRAKQRMEFEGLIKVARSIINTGCSMVILYLGYGLNVLLTSQVIIVFLTLIGTFAIINARFIGQKSDSTERISPLQLIKRASPMALFRSFVLAYVGIGVVILGMVKGDEAVGYFGAASKLTIMVQMIGLSIANSYLPAISKSFFHRKTEVMALFSRCTSFMLIFSVPFAIFTFFWGEGLLSLVYGSKFTASSVILIILACSLVPDFLNNVLNSTLIAGGREKECWQVAVLGFCCALLLNISLVWHFGAIGTAIATIGTEVIVLFTLCIVLNRKIGLTVPWRQSIRPFYVSGVVAMIAWLIGRDNLYISFSVFVILWASFIALSLKLDIKIMTRNVIYLIKKI